MEIACLYIGVCLGSVVGIALATLIRGTHLCQCCGQPKDGYACQECYRFAAETWGMSK